jgi:DNA (cytosine-5)-methyltransferase 1
VVNAADYGFPQRRRRVFIYAHLLIEHGFRWRPIQRIYETGVFARSFPVSSEDPEGKPVSEEVSPIEHDRDLHADPYIVSAQFGLEDKRSFFKNAGVMMEGKVWTREVLPITEAGPTLGDVLNETGPVPEEYFISSDREDKWKELKGSKAVKRIDPKTQFEYTYSEGTMRFPDPLDRPARTILTGEGGISPSRFKHAVADPIAGRLRRLTPEELEALNGFERGWTRTGMPVGRRAFMMGNALVVGVVTRIAEQIAADVHEYAKAQPLQE